MKKEKLQLISLRELAESWGINYEVCRIKSELIENIKHCCKKEKISQRALAKMVPGLSQDRVSKIFNDQIGHMTIDKLVQILSVLKIKVSMSSRKMAEVRPSGKSKELIKTSRRGQSPGSRRMAS